MYKYIILKYFLVFFNFKILIIYINNMKIKLIFYTQLPSFIIFIQFFNYKIFLIFIMKYIKFLLVYLIF